MLSGAATPVRLKRPNLRSGAAEFHLPAGLGVFFKTCWTGHETSQHYLENGICPNCGRSANSDRLVSLHAIDHRQGQWTTAHVIALDNRWTHVLARAIESPKMLVRPLLIKIGHGDQVSILVREQNIDPCDMRKASDRIVSVWNHHFRGKVTIGPDLLGCGMQWIE